MSATHPRTSGSLTALLDFRLSGSADVACRFEGLAALPTAQILPAQPSVQSDRAAKGILPTGVVPAIFAVALMAGCSSAGSSLNRDCSQTAACRSNFAAAPDAPSTEGGELDHQSRAREDVPVPAAEHDDVSAGGTASNQGGSGTGNATRDRRGLVDAWPTVATKSWSRSARLGLSSGN